MLAWSLSSVAALNIALQSVSKDNPELNTNDIVRLGIEKMRENYKSPDDLKQDIISRISMIQSDILYVPGTKSKEKYEMQKTRLYKYPNTNIQRAF